MEIQSYMLNKNRYAVGIFN